MYFFEFTIFIVLSVACCKAKTTVSGLPEYLIVCHRSDPHLSDCVRRSVEALRPHLKAGIPELNIPSCEPLGVPKVELVQASGPVSVKSTYSNIKIWGGTDFILKAVKIDLDKDQVKLKLNIPRLQFQSNYQIEGKILLLPIVGKGMAYGNYSDIEVMAKIQNERYRNPDTGKMHFRVDEFLCDFQVKHATIRLDNLFNGDELLSEAMNRFLNDNWEIVAKEIKPALEKTMQKLFKNFSNKLYARYPIDTLLPP